MGEFRTHGLAADVFAGWDHVQDEPVAVELYRRDARPAHRYRREREVAVFARLDHPGILRVRDRGLDPTTGWSYVVTDQVDGLTLAERIRRGPHPLPRVLTLGADLADALAHLHRAGLMHRHLTPAAVRLAGIQPVLCDLGDVATPDIEAITIEQGTVEQGVDDAEDTAAFLAPEQASGRAVGPAADVHALGRILRAVLDTPPTHAVGRPRPATPTPPALDALLHAMTDPEPTRRPAAEEVIRSLRAATPTRPGPAGRPGRASTGGG